MNKREKEIANFFAAYEKRFNDGLTGKVDIEGTMQSFADCFVEASPLGIQCAHNGNDFRNAIPKGYDFYRSIGTQAMTITGRQIKLIDDLHAMVTIHWKSTYQRKQDSSQVVIEFDVHYFTQQQQTGGLRIFAFITGDERKVLREHGLV